MRAKVGQNVRVRMTCISSTHGYAVHVYRRDKLKLQNGRGIIILKRRWKELGCKINNYTYLTLLKFLIYSDKRG